MEKHIKAILEIIEPNPERSGIKQTPERVAESLKFLTKGYHLDPHTLFKNSLIPTTQTDLMLVKNIEFYSICEHHLLPFFGKCHIAYIPNKNILGLSKFAEVVDIFARRLQIQENLCEEIASCIQELLNPKGLAVIIDAEHLCMKMRGVQKQHATFTTQKLIGELAKQDKQQMLYPLLFQ
jgi:GTP cyclohydrolase I